MSLLGTPLVVVLALAAILVPLVTVWSWNRLRGSRVARHSTRLGLLLVGQLVTVALVGVLANDYGQFYTSWSGLFGQTARPTVTTFGAKASAAMSSRHPQATLGPATSRMQVTGNTGWNTPAQWDAGGKVVAVQITGFHSKLAAPADVYLPPQYFQSAYAHQRFPAVEVMTGYPGSALNLISRMNYPQAALDLVRAGKAKPMIYVMLSSTVAPPRDTECTDVPGGPQAETFLSTDLTEAAQHAFRVQPGHWGVIGDSTGGYCAAKLTMLHPGIYAGGVSLSGYYHALDGGTAGDLFHGSSALQHASDLRWRLGHHVAPPVSLFVTIGRAEDSDGQGFGATMQFVRMVRQPMQVTLLVEQNGGHNFTTWDRELPRVLSWLSAKANTSTAATTSSTSLVAAAAKEVAPG
ncbi:esterase family protein [Humibacillus sp. DSM 29435]|uniref:alpha/beta hydrolase n=1 Tax=Humibacillus sp. DSM 29435 TaxID=1869167 RepID=UPI000B1BEBE1|nr:alpha/beta hydrolase-fold protein [Humibacillus sp. DSM 29435]